jgi:hypothetical protein
VHAFGRTLRCWGELRLVAVPAAGGERYYVALDDEPPLGTFARAEEAVRFFEALRGGRRARRAARRRRTARPPGPARGRRG